VASVGLGGNQENSRGRGLMGSGKGERSAGKGGFSVNQGKGVGWLHV